MFVVAVAVYLAEFFSDVKPYGWFYFHFFQLILFELFFFLIADVHCAFVGRQAG